MELEVPVQVYLAYSVAYITVKERVRMFMHEQKMCGSIWRSGLRIGLAIGDRGFNPSRCTVEFDLGNKFPLSPSSIICTGVSWE